MNRILISFILSAAGILFAADPGELILENATVKLVMRAEPAWRVASLNFPAAGFQAKPAEPIPLYQLEWYEKGALETLNSFQARSIEARKAKDTLVFRFAHDKQKLEIECRVWSAPDGLHWGASFRNASPAGKPAIFRYPGIGIHSGNGPLDAALSVADGVRIRDVFGKLAENESRSWEYPGMLSSQLTAWYGRTGGMALYAADSAGYYKAFRAMRFHDHIIPTFEHIVVGFKQAAFALPYAVVTAPFRGGWEAGADVYRDWAVKQPWCGRTLKERRLPAAVEKPSFVLCSHIRMQSGNRVTDESQAIPLIGEAFRNALGMPIVNLFFSWEKHGPWVAPDYFPPYPDRDAFDRMTRAIHSRKDRTMVYLSGLNVTLAKTTRHGAPTYRLPDILREQLRPSAIVGKDLRILTQGTPQDGVGQKWVLCPTTEAAANQVLDGVGKSLDLGVDIIQVDQVVGGGVPPCFAEGHNHPWAGLNKITQAFAGILRRAQEKSAAKGAALSLEGPGEYFIPYIDIVHSREYMEGAWPREGKGVEGIPLFTYLYHDYLLGYGGDAQLLGEHENLPMAIYGQAINLMAGRYPAGALWMHRPDYAKLNPKLKKAMIEIAAIWRSEARDFLIFGKARRIPYAFPEHTIAYSVNKHRHEFKTPVFLSMSYLLGGKEIGIFINTTLTDQPLDVTLLSGSRNLEAIWPATRVGKPVDVSKPMSVGSHQIIILRRSV